jgi:nucleoside-diphosphate-sugar epimerase
MSGRRLVVTGGAGFIGSHLTEALLGRGDLVTVIDDLSSGFRENLPAAATFIEGSILDAAILAQGMVGAEGIFHLAAVPSVPRSIREPLLSHAANATGTLMVLEAARCAGVRRVVYAASSSAQGEMGDRPRTETMSGRPRSPYAVAKYSGELYGHVYNDIHGLEVVSLRYFNVYGPRQHLRGAYTNVIPGFLAAALRGTTATVFGDGKQTRDFTFVGDVVRATLLALDAVDARGHTINVGSGRSVTVAELVDEVSAAVGRSLRVTHAPARPEDVRYMQVDGSLADRLLGFTGSVTLSEGLRVTAEWFMKAGLQRYVPNNCA